MDGETARDVEEFEKVLQELKMKDFSSGAESDQASVPDVSLISVSPMASSGSMAYAELPKTDAVKDMKDMSTIGPEVNSSIDMAKSSSVPKSASMETSEINPALVSDEAQITSGSVIQSTNPSDSDGIYLIPDSDWIPERDALLADLESTTSHISKQAVFLPDETPYSFPIKSDSYQEVSSPPSVTSHPAEILNGTESKHPSNQSLSSVQKSPSPRTSQSEEEHVYSFPNKQKSIDSPASVMSSSLGSNLSELDRLLLELNAVQHSTPSFPTEEVQPPKPALNTQRLATENGLSSVMKAPPPKVEKPKRQAAGRGVEDVRPNVDSLLNELTSSVSVSVPPPSVPVIPEMREIHEETPAAQQQARISASSATRELDELMASLSDFKVQSNIMAQGKSSPSNVQKQGNKLDNMLGSLQSDLNRLGVQTVAKGVCGACKKPIAGQVVTAMGRTWHPEHFVCTHCQEEIGSRNFFERDGEPYCEKDYHSLFSPRCHYCNGPILDKVVTALDKTWHPEHFFCAQCGSFFGPDGFHEKEGKAYCRKDYFDMFAPKCGGCARAILENYISALSSLWHPECFVCRECFTPFVNGSFFDHEGQPYCEAHYHERRGSLCSGCQKPITGRCITAMGKKFHPEHFVCAFCLKQLNKGTFKEQNDKPYCQSCYVKLFS
ncbi:paxillin a isoform X4 [Misgurnus anguillicaudatus]|uniref:paxillin a isoform X4 n=1 Tax=Misgurnus anguillicaudatus TaxID=75329 RepID=UPI003CCF5D14